MRLSITFDSGDARYQWLNKSLFVAAGRLLGTGRIEYAVYRVTYGDVSKLVLEFVGRRTVCTRHLAIPSLFNHNPLQRDSFRYRIFLLHCA